MQHAAQSRFYLFLKPYIVGLSLMCICREAHLLEMFDTGTNNHDKKFPGSQYTLTTTRYAVRKKKRFHY